MSGPWRLTREQLYVCWHALDLGEPPYLLRLAGLPGRTVADSRRHRDELLTALVEHGLCTENRLPVPVLAEALELLARPDYRLDIRFTGPADRPTLGLGAAAGGRALLVAGTDGLGPVELLALDASQLMGRLLALLGPVRAGRGVPVNIPGDVLDQAIAVAPDGDLWALADELRARGVPFNQAASLAWMCTGVNFGGQLGASAAARDSAPERRAEWVIGFHRGESGYFMNLRLGGTVTICPADDRQLARHWADLLESLDLPADQPGVPVGPLA